MSNWESVLTSALDGIRYAVVLLDEHLDARFINRAYYRLWGLLPAPPGKTYNVTDLIAHARNSGAYDTGGVDLDDYVRGRLAVIRDGTRPAMHLKLGNGRILNFESRTLPDGGRMLTFDDITDLVETADRLRVFATIDDLTKLLNRRQFMDLLTTEFGRSQRHGRPLSVLMIDADDFKRINDRHGHSAGDDVLRAMAGRCLGVVRKGDLVGRLGGEEFAIALADTDMQEAHKTAERLRRGVAGESFAVDGDKLQVTVSIGVAARRVQHTDPSELLRFADRALYAAKANGRNCVVADTGREWGD